MLKTLAPLFGAVLLSRMNASVGLVPGHEVLGPDPAMKCPPEQMKST